jgi:LmbE family N-acetylglucosaminyl deacetylase
MKILIIAPHMDDEVLGVGGTIARHVDLGDEVKVCIVANRAYDHKYDNKKIEEEKKSTKKAQKILGYQHLKFLDLPDEQLDNKIIDIIIPLEKVYIDFKPDIVYINHHSDVNQDHQAVFKAGMIVCRTISSHKIKKIYSYEVPSSTDQSPPILHWSFIPNFYVNIESYLEKKIQALRCYDRESRIFPNPRSPEGIRNYSIKRGMEAGLNAAEAFIVIKEIWS